MGLAATLTSQLYTPTWLIGLYRALSTGLLIIRAFAEEEGSIFVVIQEPTVLTSVTGFQLDNVMK